MSAHVHDWAVILAGGEGQRLRSLTRLVSGDDRPKQFCPLLGGRTLLDQTRQRIGPSFSTDRTLFVLLGSQERFYSEALGCLPKSRLIEQPSNRGTLPAILSSLLRILHLDPDAVVGFFPSDHHYSEEKRFLAGVSMAFRAAEDPAQGVILLGAPAQHPAVDYGWIEAEAVCSPLARHDLLRVKRFWEKPSRAQAQELWERGAVWNTFVMIGRAQAFVDLIRSATPELYRAFQPLWTGYQPHQDATSMKALYDLLEPLDFSRTVLSNAADKLSVLNLGNVGWSDLGEPDRVMAVLSHTGAKREWTSHLPLNTAATAAS